MSYTNKIDALDFIIDILKEHEKRLDEISARLENVLLKAEETWGIDSEDDYLERFK